MDFIEKKLNKKIDLLDCRVGCYIYTLSGILKRNGFGLFKLEANSGFIKKKEDCCEKNK